MMPQHVLSSVTIPGPFLPPDDDPPSLTSDREYGGVALRDASQGLRVKIWTATLVGNDVRISAPGVTESVLFTRSGVTEISLAFDQNMNPAIAFMQSGQMWLWWFDSVAVAQVFTAFDAGSSPRLSLDDKRATQRGNSDIILAYMVGNSLRYREQRDRFLIEYTLAVVPSGYSFDRVGINTVNRLQFAFSPIPESP